MSTVEKEKPRRTKSGKSGGLRNTGDGAELNRVVRVASLRKEN